jgi:hypothetical protein
MLVLVKKLIILALILFMQDSRLVYKHYATLYFVLVFDSSENELAMLDLIQGNSVF